MQIPNSTKKLLVLSGVFYILDGTSLFIGITYIPYSEAVVLFYIGPIVATVMGGLILREKVYLLDIFLLLICLVAIVIYANPMGFLTGN